ncbi:MAG: site-specific DNA-methyltransferase [Ignavibacteria bacterium]|nr:site-specific DNA-methyltransferase [Ignavibacteria bacterium]
MAQLQFKGKQFVQNHHLTVKYHELVPDKKKSLTDKVRLDDNLIIHGDNLLALKALLPTYAGKIKCIYIDPPYNTGNENWVYNDNVNSPMMQEWLGEVVDKEDLTRHDKWLCMMMPRLKLLKDLLRDDGVIFISIDDNELENLIIICDEIFVETNRFGLITIKNNPRGRRLGTELAVEHEYLLAYCKDINKFKAGRLELTEEQLAEYSEKDLDGRRYRPLGLRKRGALSKRTDRPNLHYPLYVNTKTGEVSTSGRNGFEKVIPKLSDGTDGVWRWSKSKVEKDAGLLFGRMVKRKETGINEWDVYEKDFAETEDGELKGRLFPTIWLGSEFNTETGRDQINELFGKTIFDYPKPVDFIKHVLILAGFTDGFVLDSFAGSGTTGQAVLELNNADGRKRKFVLVECEDYANSVTAERIRRVIKTLQNERNTFSYFLLGKPIEMENILSGKNLPTYKELARYVFYTATGEEFNEKKIDEKKFFIGESKQYKVYLFYKPDIKYLKSTALTLEIAESLGQVKGKKRLVFAPTKYLDQDQVDRLNIDFAQLPFEIYKLAD